MDSFPMVVQCHIRQDWDHEPKFCLRCSSLTDYRYTYCALCAIQEELGEWKRPEFI